MNNISGFSPTLLPAQQGSTSESIKGHDAAASDQQQNAFGDVLAGLSQQGGQPQASGSLQSGAWKALANQPFPNDDRSSNPGNSFDAVSASLNEAATDEKSASARALSQNPAQSPLPAGKSAKGDSRSQDASASPGQTTPGNLNVRGQTQALSGRAIGSAAASLVSEQAAEDDVADLPAAMPDSTGQKNKTLNSPVSKGASQTAAAPQPPAKTAADAQTPAAPASAATQQQAATVAADTGQASQLVTLVSTAASDAGQHVNQTNAPSSSANTDRRRRLESDSAQTPTASNTDAQLAGAAMAMINVAPVAAATPTTAASAGSQPSTTRTHGLPGADVDPASATLSALDTKHDQETPEELGVPVKLDSVSQTTHFAPVAWLSPTQQIVDAVGTAFQTQTTSDVQSGASASASATSSASPTALPTTTRSSSVSLKTLDLQLDPQDLGAVSIKLNLSSSGLTVEVQASQAATADLLEKDKRALTDGLNGAGYTVSGVEIGVATSNTATTGFTEQGLMQNSSGQSWSGDSQSNSGSQAQDGANDSFSRQNPNQNGQGNPEVARSAAQRSAGSGLYI